MCVWNSFSTSSAKHESRSERETWSVLEGSLEGERGEERQSAMERRKGSGSFLTTEDLRRETGINCSGRHEELKLENIIGLVSIGFGIISISESGRRRRNYCTFELNAIERFENREIGRSKQVRSQVLRCVPLVSAFCFVLDLRFEIWERKKERKKKREKMNVVNFGECCISCT